MCISYLKLTQYEFIPKILMRFEAVFIATLIGIG